MNELLNEWKFEQMNESIMGSEQLMVNAIQNKRANEWMNEWMNEWIVEWMDKGIHFQ